MKPEWSRYVAKFKGEKISVLDVKSFVAKAVRDGDEDAALRWMRILYDNKAKCWKQLLVRSVEDIGMADLTVMDDLLLLKRSLKKRIHRLSLVYGEIKGGGHQAEWLCIILGTMLVCRARKHRATDNASIWLVKEHPTWMPSITQELFDEVKAASEAAIADLKAGRLPVVPDKAWDMHTSRGRAIGRGLEHFKTVASELKNEAKDIPDFIPPQ